ncbi:hypothetical protein ACRAWD_31805 [Caulobacter segnis]
MVETRVDASAPAYAFHSAVRPLGPAQRHPRARLDEGSPDGRLFPEEVLGRAYRSAINAQRDGNAHALRRSARFGPVA